MAGDISTLLQQWRGGDPGAAEEVVARTYAELRRIARAHLRGERRGHTLQTTALLHEAYLRLLRQGPGSAEDREAFLRLMSSEMRRRLIDHARRRMAQKRGGRVVHEPLDSSVMTAAAPEDASEIEARLSRLDEALAKLNADFPRALQVVQLRFLVGLTAEETASQLDLSVGTVKRDWAFARAWLAAAMASD